MTARTTDKADLDGKTCIGKDFRYSYKGVECGKPAKVTHDGQPYCGRHDPKKAEDRRAAYEAKWKKEQEEREARYAAEDKAEAEIARKLERYDEAISLLKKCEQFFDAHQLDQSGDMPLLTPLDRMTWKKIRNLLAEDGAK